MGRKKLPPTKKKKRVVLFIEESTLEQLGGEEHVKATIYEFIKDQLDYDNEERKRVHYPIPADGGEIQS